MRRTAILVAVFGAVAAALAVVRQRMLERSERELGLAGER